MGIFDRFPYSSTHEMNLDYMLGKATEIAEDMQQVTAGMEQVQAGLTAISEKTEQATQAAAQAAQSASSIEGSVTAAEEAAEDAQMHNESAQTWANNAMTYKADCQRAATEAAASSSSAAQAATAAAASEDTVAQYAQAANASAQSAANNNDSAHQYANQASASASNATFHSSNAQTAATNANTSATNAETAATNAQTAATRTAALKDDCETLHRMCTAAVDQAATEAVNAANSAAQAAAAKTDVETLVESLPEDFTDLNNTVNQLSDEIDGIKDASITFDKILTRKSEMGDTTAQYITESGNRTNSSYFRTTRYIPVHPGDTITATNLNLNIGGGTIYGVACYDANKTFIQNVGIKGSTSSVSGSFIVPDNCMYVAISDLANNNPIFNIPAYTFDFGEKITENTKRKTLNNLEGKIICNFGDSIFGNARPPVDVSTFLANNTGATVYNCAFGGCRMGYHTNENYDKFSMYKLADAIASGDWTAQETAAQVSGMPSYFAGTVAMLENINFSTVDILTISYGTNDFADGLRLGGDTNTSTDWALRYSIQTILTAFPNIRIFVCVPFYRIWLSDGQFSEDSNTKEVVSWTGGATYKLTDFVQAEKETCKALQTPVLDTYYDLGINRYNWTQYFPANDGTHHNETGRKLIAEYLSNHLW